MKLGDAVQLTVSVPEVAPSLEFYKLLGFRVIAKSDEQPYTWATLTDGIIVLSLNQSNERYFGLTYFSLNIHERVQYFEQNGVEFAHKEVDPSTGTIRQAVIWGNIGIGMVERDPATCYLPTGNSIALCGRFGELSLQTANLFMSIQSWMQFGFKVVQQEPAGALLTDNLIAVGVHMTKNWNIPSLIYFTEPSGQEILSLHEMGLPVNIYTDNRTGAFSMASSVAPDGLPFFFLKKY